MPSSKTLYLIDGSALAYRSYFAFIRNPLINSKGENTSAVFGFLRFIFKIFDEQAPDYFAVVFDPPGPTFRHKQYSAYKATRQKMPDDMRDQLPRIHEAVKALNIPLIEVPGYEADDVIGTLAKRSQQAGVEAFLVSGDKDFMQLVDSHIKLYNPKRSGEEVEVLDEKGVEEKVGLPPSQIVDFLGLMGDTSDNVPGVPGVGGKTAVKLIREFGSLEQVLEHADQVSRANVRENLKSHRDEALLSKRLVTIDTRVPVEVDLQDLQRQPPDPEVVIELLKDLEFTSLIERFTTQKQTPQAEYHLVDSEEKVADLARKLRESGKFVVDLETTERDPMRAEVVGMAFSIKTGEAYYLPVRVEKRPLNPGGSRVRFEREMYLDQANGRASSKSLAQWLKPILEDEGIKKSGQNIKYDMMVLSRHGIELRGVYFDTMVASYLLNPTLRQHNLDALALEHLNYVKIPTSDLIGKGKKQISMSEVSVEEVAKYACEDTDVTLRLQELFEPKLKSLGLEELFREVEVPLIYVLMDIEKTGVALDLDYLSEMSRQMKQKLDELMVAIYAMAGEAFNINSTQQLGHILFDKLQLPRLRRTKTGYSTDAKVLEELAKFHDLPRTLLEYRELTKLKSTYVDALPRLVNPETGRVHCSFNQTVAATGRLSSSDPNLQNIPIRTETGRQIRRAFVPGDPEHLILDADYSQIELRIMAHLSRDPVLIEAFKNDEDIHTKTAALVFNVAPEEVTAEHRRRAKEINFGIMYGMGAYGLSSRLHISMEEAQNFITNYFVQYPKVNEFIIKTISEARQNGFVTTMLNRRRYLPEINSDNRNRREFAERTAINTPIQGTAADLIKVAMINIWNRLRQPRLATKMIMQVHDELVLEVPKSELAQAQELVRTEMETAIKLEVPVKVDVGVGESWLEAG
ncbi:MAG: DNA polymerase I [bacterium]